MTKKTLTIATRQSPLALWQANFVKAQLEKFWPDISIRLLPMKTTADKLLDMPLISLGGKGLFVKELEEALLEGRADIAVHSMKDVPPLLPEGLCLPVMCQREDPRDVIVSKHFQQVSDIPPGALIGTSSLRRQSQLKALRPDVKIVPLRGNINTRLQYLEEAHFDAIILASAGLKRLDLLTQAHITLSVDQSLPAAGQGVLGIECREEDEMTKTYISPLQDTLSFLTVTAERAMCQRIGAGCRAPVAAFAEIIDTTLHLRGLVGSLDGTLLLKAAAKNSLHQSTELGFKVADALIEQGAAKIIQSLVGKC